MSGVIMVKTLKDCLIFFDTLEKELILTDRPLSKEVYTYSVHLMGQREFFLMPGGLRYL